jgi:membrane protein
VVPDGWRGVAGRVRVDVRDQRSSLSAAGVAFYGFLSLGPALAAAVSVYGLVVDPSAVEDHVGRAFAVLPDEARQLLVTELTQVVEASSGALGGSFVVAVVVALWSASRGFRHLLDAIAVAYGAADRGFVRRRAAAFGCTVVAMVVAGLAIAAFAVLPDHAPGGPLRWLVRSGLWCALAGIGLVGLELVYRLGAGRDRPRRTWVAPGSRLALLLLVAVTVGLDVYAAHLGSYNALYGALTGVVVLMLWLHLVALIVIVGAQVNADLDR